jgi:hypothetical protein
MRRLSSILALTLAAACSGSDPCGASAGALLLQGTRFPDQVELIWSGADAGSYEIWAFGGAHEDVYVNPIAVVADLGVDIGLDDDAGTVVFETRPVIGGKACPTPDSALSVPVAPGLNAAAVDGGVQLSWEVDPIYEPLAQLGRGPDENSITPLAVSDGGTYLDATAGRGSTYVYALQRRAKNLVALSAPQTVQTN